MTNNQLYKLQMEFTKLHIPFAIILVLFIIERNITNSASDSMFSILFIVIALITEVILYKKQSLNNFKYFVVLRYYELCVASISFLYVNSFYFNAIIILIYFLLYMEFITIFDYSDHYIRFLSVLVAILPIVLTVVTNTLNRDYLNEDLVIRIATIISAVIIITYIGNLFQNKIRVVEEKLFSQNRLLHNLNETNEALQIHQDKLKHANEELSYQKVMLEAAYEKINSVNIEIMIQNQIVKYISSSLEIGKLMTLITDSIFNELSLKVCAISLNAFVVENKKMIYKIQTSFEDEYELFLSDRIEQADFQPYLDNGKSFVDNHVEKNKYSFVKKNETGSILIVPLIQDQMQIGFIFVQDFKYEAFVESVEFYEGIVAQFLIALSNAKLYSKMENMAIHDTLTGIYNRGHLSKLLNEYLTNAIIDNSVLTVALFDIDKFKNINDTYGHLFGDEVIKAVAVIADETAVENNGIAGRYGGEEFVVIFPNKGIKEAYEVVVKLHRDIKEKGVLYYGEDIHVNVSIGITSYPETCKNPDDLLNRADGAMYYSKENGRDRITIDSDEIRV